jgi:homoserine kinase
MMITIKVPATTANLGPGFDCLGLALEFFNIVEVEYLDDIRPKINISGEGATDLSRGKDNLVYQALLRLFHEVGQTPPQLHLQLKNKIPLARGLGSSASAIVAGLLAANYLCKQPLSQEELLYLAIELEGHPDNVAPALLGGLVISSPKGSGLGYHYLKLDPPRELQAVLCVPDFFVATEDARRVLPDRVDFQDAVFNVGRVALLLGSVFAGRWDLFPEALQDRLHQNQRKSLVPGMDLVISRAQEAGALGAALSGSGPTIIAFILEEGDRVGAAMQGAFSEVGIQSKVFTLALNRSGAQILPTT